MSYQDLREAFPDIPDVDTLQARITRNGNQIITIGNRSIEVGAMASNAEIRRALLNTGNTKMTVLPNRLLEKLNRASGVVKRVSDAVEAKADAVIAREEPLLAHADKAFALHIDGLDQASSQLDQIESALSLLSNGGPALD